MLDLESEFPILQNHCFLNHAAVAPLPARSADALRRWAEQAQTEIGHIWPEWADFRRKTRIELARFLGCKSDEVAFAHNTTHGLLCIANSLDWRPGDNVVIAEHEFPANVYPWKNLGVRGVACKVVPEKDRRFRIEDFEACLDSRTRLVSVSAVQYSTGYRMPLEELAELCRKRGVLFCVDAIQALGAMPIDVGRIACDFLVADGHKWLLAPEGLAVLYVRRERLEELNASMTGWAGRQVPGAYEDLDQPLRPMAMRFEEGSHAMALIAAFGHSLSLLREVGITEVWRRIEGLTDRLSTGLRRLDFKVESPREEGVRSGIVAFSGPWKDPKPWVDWLGARDVYIAGRRGWLRASPHFYNQDGQIDHLLDCLTELRKSGP
jgi:selenocysteine lyase/cysteine desulfurase